jgi:hypothetical protein
MEFEELSWLAETRYLEARAAYLEALQAYVDAQQAYLKAAKTLIEFFPSQTAW